MDRPKKERKTETEWLTDITKVVRDLDEKYFSSLLRFVPVEISSTLKTYVVLHVKICTHRFCIIVHMIILNITTKQLYQIINVEYLSLKI